MQNSSRRASAVSASQLRRSSRAASRNDSTIAHASGSRSGSRRGSAVDQDANSSLLDQNIEWNNSDFWADFAGNADVVTGFDHGFEDAFNFQGLPDAARASVSLLQHPFSAFPGTPHAMNLNNALQAPMPYYSGFAPYTPQLALDQASPSRPRQQLQLSGPVEVASIAPVSPKSKRKVSKSLAEVQVQAPLFNDDFAGYVGDEQAYEYPEPVQQVLSTQFGPYYGNVSSQYQDEVLNQRLEAASPDTRLSKRTRSRTCSTESRSHRSVSSYPDRSDSGSAGDHMRGPSRADGKRNMSVVGGPDYFKYAVPKIDVDKPWIRINKTTRGDTTRTAKCNDFDPAKVYTYEPHPLGDWSSGRFDFKYTPQGEWKDLRLPAAAIRDFILRYPEDTANGIKLKLQIQVGPTDSARRYLSQTWTKCRFAECPTYANQSGTILHGHYRVAFDERSYGNKGYDPHLAAGAYVHLYCLERFLDLEFLCKKAHVYVDDRTFPNEPRGKFAATLNGHPEHATAQAFVKEAKAKNGNVRNIEGFENYPRHEDYKGKPKPHKDTLVCRMHETKAATRPPAQLKQFKERGFSPSHLLINKGDLELYMAEVMRKKALSAKTKGKARKRKVREIVFSDESSESDNDSEYRKKRRRLIEEAKKDFTPSAKKRPGRPRTKHKSPHAAEPWDGDDSDSDPEFDAGYKPSVEGSRRSARAATRKRRDYREIEEPPVRQQQDNYAQGYTPTGFVPQMPNLQHNPLASQQQQQAPVPQPSLVEDNAQRRRSSLPLFVDPSMEGIDLEAYFAKEGLDRRTSSAAIASTRRGSILRDPTSAASRNGSLGKRHASFSRQPVSHQQEYDTEAPPRDVETRPRTRRTQTYASKPKTKGGRVSRRRSSWGRW